MQSADRSKHCSSDYDRILSGMYFTVYLCSHYLLYLQDSIRAIGFSFFPQSWGVEAYTFVFKLGRQLWVSYFNSFFITVVGTLASLLVTILYAYALFRKDFKYRIIFSPFSASLQ